MKIVMKTLFEKQYTKEVILYQRSNFNLNCPRTIKTVKILGLSQGLKKVWSSLYDLSSHRALKKQVTISDTNVYLDV